MILTSLSNPTVRHLVRMRDNRARRREGRVLVDGWRETQRALESGLVPLGVYTTEDDVDDDREAVLRRGGDAVRYVSPAVMEKIGYGQSARGVVAEFQTPSWSLDELSPPGDALILVLDGIEKPGNVGAAFRCADAAGADAVLLTPAHCDRFNPNAIRSSLGTVFSVPSAVAEESQARTWLAARGVHVYAARVESSRPIWESKFVGPTAFVIGSEARGLEDRWESDDELSVTGIHLPMRGRADSLNASVSAAVLLYEAQRQRGS
ncbi:MAG: RNA methyltransferase [Planctomycetota bacterium]